MELQPLLDALFTRKGSDLHVRMGTPPVIRVDGKLYQLTTEKLRAEELTGMIESLLTKGQLEKFHHDKEFDLAIGVPGHGRARVNLYFQRGTPAIAIRAIKIDIPSIEELNLPEVLSTIAGMNRGIVLVTGATGSGKSTTLAAMIEYINSHRSLNIITIEDPIEFIFRNKKSIIAQREIHIDTNNFLNALVHSLREDPDVIMVGEIRNPETMKIALQAAETGHLVLTTLHTLNAVETINRIISFFELHEQGQVREMVASTLQAVVSQRLVPRSDQEGRVPVVEVLINTAAVKECLQDVDKMHTIIGLIEDDKQAHGMQTFDQSILQFHQNGIISYEDAKQYASNPNDFELACQGIVSSAGHF
jgi:twitching motility protein PilT